jgi:acyl-CoA thioester hydrolase
MSWDLPSPFLHERVAVHTEIDGYGHVNNVVYLAWLDDCAWAHSTVRGVPPELCRRLNRGMAVWRTQVHYIGAAYEGDRVHYVCIDLETGRAKRMPPEFATYTVAADVAEALARETEPFQPGVEPR